MKKIAKILLPLALCFVLLAGCGQKVEWANPEDYQDHPYQELSLGELADPERIVLAKNGREKSVFEKGSDEYEHLTTMIRSLIDTELDKNEQIEELGRKLDQTMFYMKLDEGTYLIYEYPADSYAPVYFFISGCFSYRSRNQSSWSISFHSMNWPNSAPMNMSFLPGCAN